MAKKKRRPPFPAPPKAKEIRAARKRLGLGQAEAAALIYYTTEGWQKLEYGTRKLHPGLWELWQIKTANIPPVG